MIYYACEGKAELTCGEMQRWIQEFKKGDSFKRVRARSVPKILG